MSTTMKHAILGAAALALASAAANAATWSNTAGTLPVISTITGGPWTLNDPTQTSYYCKSPTSQTTTAMRPYYFPFIVGASNNLIGYFDYRPSGANEMTVAAQSLDAGKTWTWAQQALQQSSTCPSGGDDRGLGHPFVINLGGANFLYLLDRRKGHVDVDGLTVRRITPTLTAPLHANPALNTTVVDPVATVVNPGGTSGTIAAWAFSATIGQPYNAPTPTTGTGTAKMLGMTNNYTYSSGCTGNKNSIASGDVVSTAGTLFPATTEFLWRVRGGGSNSCNGWNLSAPQYSQGAEFDVSIPANQSDVIFAFDWYSTTQGVRDLQVQYNLDTNNTAGWTNIGSPFIATSNDFYTVGGAYKRIQIDLGADTDSGGAGLAFPNATAMPRFGMRLVSAYSAAYAATHGGQQTYASAQLGAGGAVQQYNNNSGNWRFGNITFGSSGAAPSYSYQTAGTDFATPTSGLLNPDGLLAVVPNTNPKQVLYVQKQLTSATVACPANGVTGSVNGDVDTIRLATTTDGVHFTDKGPTNLVDGTKTGNLDLRYAAPNGSIVKLGTATDSVGNTYNKFGLFFGAGNCQDGDSDGFHAIVYAENTDATMLNWTIIHGMNNPIAAVAFGQAPATAPLTGTSSVSSTGQNGWFGGRVYTPQVIPQFAPGATTTNTVSMVFAGYNYDYFGSDLSNYRTIGQIKLTSSQPIYK